MISTSHTMTTSHPVSPVFMDGALDEDAVGAQRRASGGAR
jgi:hypothetical protein